MVLVNVEHYYPDLAYPGVDGNIKHRCIVREDGDLSWEI